MTFDTLLHAFSDAVRNADLEARRRARTIIPPHEERRRFPPRLRRTSARRARAARARPVPYLGVARAICRLSGASLGALIEMSGQQASRRYELQALQVLLAKHARFFVATGGGIVSESATYELLLRECLTIWVRTTPEEHMGRVLAQGDKRPMAGSAQAMEDLRRILDERTPLYERADLTIDTTGTSVEETIGIIMPRLSLRTSA